MIINSVSAVIAVLRERVNSRVVVVLTAGNHKKEISGGEAMTTNNRMELLAVISALECLKRPCTVELYTDSQYIERAVNEGWLAGWVKRGWKRKDGELKNPELWQRLWGLLQLHSVTFRWVKGHAENELNNRCDELAVLERLKFSSKEAENP